MNPLVRHKILLIFSLTFTLLSCNGLFDGVYDRPIENENVTTSGRLYIDASDWEEWHYIDFDKISKLSINDSLYNPSSAWETYSIPTEAIDKSGDVHGIYTYWYDVYGAGITSYEYREFSQTLPQPEPENWTIAVHRNNVRTNGCGVSATNFHNISDLPTDDEFYSNLTYIYDEWNETDVWTIQDKMLLGLIGNQGIYINNEISKWLKVMLPPIPPSFTLNNQVFVFRTVDGLYGALQLENYQSSTGTKCCLTINYKYPL